MFKNITLALFAAFCVNFSAKAQFSIDEDSLYTYDYIAAFTDINTHTSIRNSTGIADTIIWTRTTNALPANWTSAVCDIITCHGETVNTSEFTLEPNQVGELSFHFYSGMNKGTGKMVVRFARKADPSYFIDVYINCQALGLSITSVKNASQINIFPNPASNLITIGSEKIKEGTYEIFNLLGEKLIGNSFIYNQKIDVSTLAKGVYFIKVQNSNASASSKLIIE